MSLYIIFNIHFEDYMCIYIFKNIYIYIYIYIKKICIYMYIHTHTHWRINCIINSSRIRKLINYI